MKVTLPIPITARRSLVFSVGWSASTARQSDNRSDENGSGVPTDAQRSAADAAAGEIEEANPPGGDGGGDERNTGHRKRQNLGLVGPVAERKETACVLVLVCLFHSILYSFIRWPSKIKFKFQKNSNFVHQSESLMLLFHRHDIEVFLVDVLSFTARIVSLHPCVVPVRIEFLARYVHLSVFDGE